MLFPGGLWGVGLTLDIVTACGLGLPPCLLLLPKMVGSQIRPRQGAHQNRNLEKKPRQRACYTQAIKPPPSVGREPSCVNWGTAEKACEGQVGGLEERWGSGRGR